MTRHSIFLSLIFTILVSGCATKNLINTDDDQDGVSNKSDICKNTPKLALVDKYGCAVDSDNDGVIDIYDKCPNTPFLTIVKSNGCPKK
ncbi:MAG: thrombospondin type 3 repeat-containing protein [Sulfurospirillum sp.]